VGAGPAGKRLAFSHHGTGRRSPEEKTFHLHADRIAAGDTGGVEEEGVRVAEQDESIGLVKNQKRVAIIRKKRTREHNKLRRKTDVYDAILE